MGATQTAFLLEFTEAFLKKAPNASWAGGQARANTASLLTHQAGRRGGLYNKAERFELGDLTTTFNGHKIVIEFESKQVPISNLLKYWPYLRGELSSKPDCPVIICHFSDWWSYGIYRDLWQWTLDQMQQDPKCLQSVSGCQFDHGGHDLSIRDSSINQSIEWILSRVASAA
ncbi:hypothetical protein GCM10027084_12190 [Pseudoxanthomonas sangjuensis]|uniref:hypothetical protein n=1 Tax=Pseudoxanthomonas sangjuensis TaxID=1503750 RepID=UPI001390C26D|nr:hypothetical protein [Pseudoxanthomonas sangjuensis]